MEVLPGVDVPLCWVLLSLSCLLFYIYTTWPFSQLQRLGISGPPPQLFFGNLRQLFSGGTVNAFKKWSEEYGRVYGIYMGRQPMIVVSDLDIVKAVMVKDFAHFSDKFILHSSSIRRPFKCSVALVTGADWKRIRSIISPTFTSGKLRQMEPQINRCGQDLTANLLELAKQGQKVDVRELFGAYTLDVIASTAFGIQVDSQKDSTDPFLINIKAILSSFRKYRFLTFLMALMPWISPVVGWLRSQSFFSQATVFYRDSIQSMIQQRKAADTDPSKYVDFLQLLINAEASDDITGTNKRLTIEEIEAQMMIFFFAGYETTATTLQTLSYSLALNPDVQQRIVTEMEQQLGQEKPTCDNVSRLKNLDHAIHETLRLYPPNSMVNRLASQTTTIKGVTIPKGFGVLVPVSQVMRDPEYFPHPHVFDPDRFSERGRVEPAAFLTFGLGPRMCVGMRLALLEVKIAMVHVLRQVKFVHTPDLPETLHFQAGIAGLDKVPTLIIKVEPREGAE